MAKRALLIGINKYRVPGADLRGCLNDVTDMRAALIDCCGFAEGDITVLTDYDATKANMQRGMESLIANSKPGDVLLLHYSGHGSNVPDKSGDEADHRDEILCPTDLDWKDPLLDDWMGELFDTVPADVSLTFVSDSCHSGSVNRVLIPPDSTDAIPRYLPCPLDLLATESGRELRGTLRQPRLTRAHGASSSDLGDVLEAVPRTDITDTGIPEVLISGCRDDQTSADAYIDGAFHGALTYALVEAIRAVNGMLTYRELHQRAIAILKDTYSQVPQLVGRTGRFDQPFLSPVGQALMQG